MRFAWGVGLLLVAAAAGAAFAELDATERKFVRSCLEALSSDSDRAKLAAEDALVRIGADAVPTIVEAWRVLPDDAARAALRRSLIRMGPSAADAVESARADWPEGRATELEDLVKSIRAAADRPDPKASTDAEVRAILARFSSPRSYRVNHPDVARLVALGRAAVPTLLDVVEAGGIDGVPAGQRVQPSAIVAVDALGSLVDESDVPRLVKILGAGRSVIARTFRRVKDPALLAALIAAVDRGGMDFDLCWALEDHAGDERVISAVCAWLSAHGASGDWHVAYAAGLLGESGSPKAAAAVLEVLPSAKEMQTLASVGTALAKLGREEGIEALIDVLDGKGSPPPADGLTSFYLAEASKRLAKITGRTLYEPTTGKPKEMDEANLAAAKRAAAEYRAWWQDAKGKIRFDPATKTWSMP